jgi:asparagine synthase (glutamine-hydrolysing)
LLLYLLQLTRDPGSLHVAAMRTSLLQAAAPFAQLDESTFVSAVSGSGCCAFASVGHSPQLVAPRKHVSVRTDALAAFDGLPLDPRGEIRAHDADALIDHWADCDRLDGQFTAVRVDLENDCFECLTDVLSMHPLYCERTGDGWLVANSVEAIRGVSGASDPDPLGVSTWLALGWAAGYRTLLGSINALPPASRVEFSRRGMKTRQHGGMRALAAVSTGPRAAPEETRAMVDDMVALTRAAAAGGMPIKCAVTAGRDSRTAIALCLAAGIRPLTTTIGPPDELDVVIGRQVADYLRLSHELSNPIDTPQLEDVPNIAPTFVSMVDGLASLSQIQDIYNLYHHPDRIGVLVWGMGGEIARAGVGPITKFAANGPLINRSVEFQTRMLRAKVRDPLGILKPTASVDARHYMDRFVAERRAEGWRPAQIGEVFYTFERIGRWGASGFRRATFHEDLYAPFCTHAFVNYAFRMSPGERYAEEAHRRILSDLDPALRDLPYATPWRAADPRLAWALSTIDLMGYLGERTGLGERLKRSHTRSRPGPRPFASEWLERHRDAHREVCFSSPDSPLFEWVDRAALERAFTIPKYDEVPAGEMLRVLTLAWYLHRLRSSGPVVA